MKARTLKAKEKIVRMRQGGRILAEIRRSLERQVRPGVKLIELERLADKLIRASGGEPSFKQVPGYHYATCITVNEGVVHGIPNAYEIRNSDIISLDIGFFFRGFHVDTATTLIAGTGNSEDSKFLEVGRQALKKAIQKARIGNHIGHITSEIQATVEKAGYSCIRTLTGHGIGAKLHEEPPVPCVLLDGIQETPKLKKNQTLAIEVIYTQGSHRLHLTADGWTLITEDRKKAGLFEETVAITAGVPIILTKG